MRGRLHLSGGSGSMRVAPGGDVGAGRLYVPDPAAVARLKAMLAQEPERKRPRRRTAAEHMAEKLHQRRTHQVRLAEQEDTMPKGTTIMNEDLARQLHARAVAGEKVKALAAEAGYANYMSLVHYWRRMELPSVSQAREGVAPAVKPEPRAGRVESAAGRRVRDQGYVAPMPEPVRVAVSANGETTVSVTGETGAELVTLDDLARRLTGLRRLADELAALGVTAQVHRKITVEVTF